MPFEEGNTLGGRTIGSLNRSTAKVREVYAQLLEDNLDQLKEDFKKLDPKDRIRLMLDMSKYVIPTLKATEYIVEKPYKPHYTTEQLDKKIKELVLKYEEEDKKESDQIEPS